MDELVDHMFQEVFTDEERQLLLLRIRRWEYANPNQSSADRVTAWIDVAYEFQAERTPRPVTQSFVDSPLHQFGH